MRQFYLYALLALSLITLALAGCKKEESVTPTTAPPPIPPYAVNTAPTVNAGKDVWLFVPTDTAYLAGLATDAQNNIEKFLWRQISGAQAAVIESPIAMQTKVSALQKGTYGFELAVTDKGGLNSKDTVFVFVQEPAPPGQGEVIFNDLTWICPMGCSLAIPCFSCYVPLNQPFQVFLRKPNSSQWVKAISDSQWTGNDEYVYGISNNTLWVYVNDTGDLEVDVKITY